MAERRGFVGLGVKYRTEIILGWIETRVKEELMHRLLILALFCATLLLRLPQTLACGGYEITGIDRMVEFADVVVSGRVKNVDDLGNNFILKVERYFKGSGSAYLPIVGTRPAWFYADTVRNYSNGCYNVRQ